MNIQVVMRRRKVLFRDQECAQADPVPALRSRADLHKGFRSWRAKLSIIVDQVGAVGQEIRQGWTKAYASLSKKYARRHEAGVWQTRASSRARLEART